MKTSAIVTLAGTIVFGCGVLLLSAQYQKTAQPAGSGPTIPPTVSRIWPAGLKRGSTAIFTVEGRSLAGVQHILFDAPQMAAKVLEVTDLPEEAKPKNSTVAPVPEGRRQAAKMEVTVASDVEPGIHRFRFQTSLGTSNMGVLEVGGLDEVEEKEPNDSLANAQWTKLPSTLVGRMDSPGDVDTYQFEGQAGEELVFQVVASRVMSRLRSMLVLRDSAGQVIAKAGEYTHDPDAVLTAKLPTHGKYTISISDRDRQGGEDYFYRLNAGAFPYVAGVFPLGVRAGQPGEVTVEGVNLRSIHHVKVQPPQWADGWTTIPLRVKTPQGVSLNKVSLAVGNDPEMMEQEPNNKPSEAQAIPIPATINGRVFSDKKVEPVDEDYFRFRARKVQKLVIEVAAARLSSPLDSLIEVLDVQGQPIPRATIRCLNQTSLTLSDRDSRSRGYRLLSSSGFHENDYIMVGEELDHLEFIPDQPDADVVMKGFGGERIAFLGTSPQVHAVNEPVYRAEILEPGAEFPSNGLPVFNVTYRNDDGGPGYSGDSRLEFEAPKDGEYLLHLKDVRGLQGKDYAYRLTIREAAADFTLMADPANPNVPRGGRVPVTVTANRTLGYEGPIEIELRGLPKGITARPATIPARQDSTVVILEAAADAPPLESASPFQVLGRAKVNGREVVRTANADTPLQVVSLMPQPDVLVTAEPKEVVLEPGKTTRVTLHVERKNSFAGRVPCEVRNLPPGVRVVNIGLNGVLVHENQSTQTFVLLAEGWAQPISQPIYVVGKAESNSPTFHASAPIALKVVSNQVASRGQM